MSMEDVAVVLKQYHSSPMGGHSGVNGTLAKVSQNYIFTITTIHVTGRAFAKQLRHVLTCLMWVNIKLNDEALLPVQAMAFNVAANKEQLIRLLVKHLCKLIAPNGKRLVVTGPDPHPIVGVLPRAITHEEANIIMVYHMIEESVGWRSPIRIVSDDTGVLIILAHHLQARTNNLPATVKITMAACSRRHQCVHK